MTGIGFQKKYFLILKQVIPNSQFQIPFFPIIYLSSPLEKIYLFKTFDANVSFYS